MRFGGASDKDVRDCRRYRSAFTRRAGMASASKSAKERCVMSRLRLCAALALSLAGSAAVRSEPATEKAVSMERYVGNVILVSEPNEPAKRCLIRKVWRHPDGTYTIRVQSVQTGEIMTIERLAE